jgi:hypothetical protein
LIFVCYCFFALNIYVYMSLFWIEYYCLCCWLVLVFFSSRFYLPWMLLLMMVLIWSLSRWEYRIPRRARISCMFVVIVQVFNVIQWRRWAGDGDGLDILYVWIWIRFYFCECWFDYCRLRYFSVILFFLVVLQVSCCGAMRF